MNPLSPYKDIRIDTLHPSSDQVSEVRNLIIDELMSQKKDNMHMLSWYQPQQWSKVKLDNCTVVYNDKDEPIALSGNKIQPDNTMKVLCYYYMFKRFRTTYKSLSQTDIIPSNVEFAKTRDLDGIWFSVHVFDERHKRLAESQKRFMNGSMLDESMMPYWKKFKYIGTIIYNHVKQEKFYASIYDV